MAGLLDLQQQQGLLDFPNGIPIPKPRPSEMDIANAQYERAMNYFRNMQTSPPLGRPLFGNGEFLQEGPLNITQNPIFYPTASGNIGAPRFR